MDEDLKACNPCVVCGSTDLHMMFDEDMFGESLKSVRCGNKKCHITGDCSKQRATAIKYWNRLTEIHNKHHGIS